MALTTKVCSPSANPTYDLPDVQLTVAPESSWQVKFAGAELVQVNTAELEKLRLAGELVSVIARRGRLAAALAGLIPSAMLPSRTATATATRRVKLRRAFTRGLRSRAAPPRAPERPLAALKTSVGSALP